MDTLQQLKPLNMAITRLIGDLTRLLTDPLVRSTDVSALQRQLTDVEAAIDRIRDSDIIVTAHAVVRYLERVMGLNIQQTKVQYSAGTHSKIGHAAGQWTVSHRQWSQGRCAR